jgi:hypothetical protein
MAALVACASLRSDDAQDLAREARKTAGMCGCCGRELSLDDPAYLGAKVYAGMWALYYDRASKPQCCKLRFERTVLCEACAPEWLSPDRDGVLTQRCAMCERPMVYRLTQYPQSLILRVSIKPAAVQIG